MVYIDMTGQATAVPPRFGKFACDPPGDVVDSGLGFQTFHAGMAAASTNKVVLEIEYED